MILLCIRIGTASQLIISRLISRSGGGYNIEDPLGEVGKTCVTGQDLGEGGIFDEIGIEVEIFKARDVVEAICLLEAIQLLMQDHPEGWTHEGVTDLPLHQATDPGIDAINTRHDELITILQSIDLRIEALEVDPGFAAQHKIWISLLELAQHVITQAIAGLKLLPAAIGLKAGASHVADSLRHIGTGGRQQALFDLVESPHTQIPASGNVRRKQVGPNTDEIVTDGVDHLAVHLFRRLPSNTAKHRCGTQLGIARRRHIAHSSQNIEGWLTGEWSRVGIAIVIHAEGRRITGRIEEKVEQRPRLRIAIGVENPVILGNHRMAKPVGDRLKLQTDLGVGRR